jgi:hypothetical protein
MEQRNGTSKKLAKLLEEQAAVKPGGYGNGKKAD